MAGTHIRHVHGRSYVVNNPTRGGTGRFPTTAALTGRRQAIQRTKTKRRRNRAVAARTIGPGTPSEEMGVRHRINQARGITDSFFDRAGQITVHNDHPHRRRRRRTQRGTR